jgi:hypothetical protein
LHLATAGTQSVTQSVRGEVVKSAECSDVTASGAFNGIAAWAGTIFGFSHTGSVVSISKVDGTGCLVASIPASLWGGGGVSTLASVVAP